MSKKPELSDPSGDGKVRIIVYVDGGVVQDVLIDTPGVDPACRSFDPVEVNPECVEKPVNCMEE